MNAQPPLSVIICTRNRCAALAGALDSLAGQNPGAGPFEIVVVDDGSKDDTAAVCRQFQAKLPTLRCVSTGNHAHLASARNLGVGTARGDLLLFTDDDCVVAPDWVESMRAALAQHPIVAGAVDVAGESFVEDCHIIAQFHSFLPGRDAGPETFIAGANMGFHRSVISEMDGFDPAQRLASDTEFILRCRERGLPVQFTPSPLVVHRPGRQSLAVAFRYARDHTAVTIRLRRRFRGLLRTPRLLQVPGALLLAAPLIAARVTARIYLGNRRLLRRLHTLPLVFALKLASCWGAFLGLRRELQER